MLTDPSCESRHYGDAADTVMGVDSKPHASSQARIWRWREAYQMHFAARMQWTVTPEFALANHAPIPVVNNDSTLRPVPVKTGFGSTIFLDVSGLGTPMPAIHSSFGGGPMTYHLVLEVVDSGAHPMRAYRRVLLQVGSLS